MASKKLNKKVIELKAKLLKLSKSPQHLKDATYIVVAAVGLGGLSLPMLNTVKEYYTNIDTETKRHALIQEIDDIMKKELQYRKLLPSQDGDLNWWIAYLLEGTRHFGITITGYRSLKPKGKSAQFGGYQGMILTFSVTATTKNLFDYIRWLEYNKHNIRIISLRMKRESEGDTLSSDLSIALATKPNVSNEPAKNEPRGS